ncbi:WW domain binding protein 11-domain-containing protein [Glomus cerebriforme]|uniref:WW domain binding protein 11-domain-containing protein n=1 Tax=Glomus cerebriforme TaxID=658196 RepID=A0A397S8R6_9GLOM|nr:WW domain binding protein 11-domain-containing protein [Glomus cerebriforme]
MVKKKSGRILNPADAHRKAMRQKEIKKNKAERKRVRTLVMVHKDTSKLEEEIRRYKSLDRDKKLDKNGKAKLKDLEDKFKKILETKKAHGVNLQKEKEKSTTTTTKEQVPVYFHPTLNPSGLPPGVVKSEEEKGETSAEDDSGSGYSDNDSETAKQESDEDIPLPPGTPPTKESDDELPELPPGPPPKKEESDDDELPDLPPGPNPNISYSHSSAMARPSPPPPPFGFNHQGPPFPPPHGTFIFNSPLGSQSHQRPNIRQPPPPPAFAPGIGPNPFSSPPPPMHPIQSQGYPVRHMDVPHPRPPPFSSQVSHYGPPPQIPGGNNNISSRTFSQSMSTTAKTNNNSQYSKSPGIAAMATPVIQAAPQVRNLQKELTTLVPTALLRKKAAASKPKVARPIVNAAPNIDDGLIDELSTITPTKRSASTAIPLLQEQQKSSEVDSSQLKGGITSSSAPSPAKKAKRKKADEYEKFMAEMQDLL